MTEFEPSRRPTNPAGYPRLTKALYAFAGIVLPLVAFACAAPNGNWAADRPWQSGEFWVYATLVLKWPAVWPFYPLLLFSMGSLGLFLWDRERYSEFYLIRLGLYGGVVVALVFCWLIYAPTSRVDEAIGRTVSVLAVILASTFVAFLLLVAVVLIGTMLLRPLAELWGWTGLAIRALPTAILLVGLLLLAAEDPLEALITPFAIAFIVLLAISPAWALAAYVCAAGSVIHQKYHWRQRWNLKSLLALSTWTACLFGAWRRAMDLAIEEYATLPTKNPNCFVCSAAAGGHRRFVRSEAICADGLRVVWINPQLRVLKAAELAMMTAAPSAHRAVRRVYNFIGPPLARRLKNPWVADAAYLALKPVEWLARMALWMLGVRPASISRIYTPKRD